MLPSLWSGITWSRSERLLLTQSQTELLCLALEMNALSAWQANGIWITENQTGERRQPRLWKALRLSATKPDVHSKSKFYPNNAFLSKRWLAFKKYFGLVKSMGLLSYLWLGYQVTMGSAILDRVLVRLDHLHGFLHRRQCSPRYSKIIYVTEMAAF